jgi:putative PIN family toxin of toxin-antitoxin system
MKIFFDTNVYVGEALLGQAAERMVQATLDARWRIYASPCLLAELGRVLTEDLGFSRRLAVLSQRRIVRRSTLVEGGSTAQVPQDPKDSPILQAALGCGADYLVTNDRHLLSLDPTEGLRIISMSDYYELLRREGLL